MTGRTSRPICPRVTETTNDTARDARLRRLRFRAWRRGFKEADLVLGSFADEHLAKLDPAGVDAFEALLDVDDKDIYAWVTGREAPPPEHDTEVMRLLKSFGYFARTLWASRDGA